ncbi:MAG: peroxide stress protein YaaA [Betaproteobacteria bacterium]|nr:peroxide stress protein YaaA [Betaproteobacteria bacterium]
MLVLLSPAKTLDFESPIPGVKMTQPSLEAEAVGLVDLLRDKTVREIGRLMTLSDKLARLNHERFQEWSYPPSPDRARPALLAFNGDVYEGLDASTLSASSRRWAQEHLRILSGLYGVLRPLDALQPYRLEMGTRLPNARGADLYRFWGHRVTTELNQQITHLRRSGEEALVVNLASEEYFKVVRTQPVAKTGDDPGGPGLQASIVHPVFQDEAEDGSFKVVSFYAKRARGLMARAIVEGQMTQATHLHSFNGGGYRFVSSLSSPERPVFRRAASDRGGTS